MPAQDEWIWYLQSNPAFYHFSKSKLIMTVLEKLSNESLSLHSAYFRFPSIQLAELEEVLESFVANGLVSTTIVSGTVIYTITEKGKEFLELYKKAEKSFTIK